MKPFITLLCLLLIAIKGIAQQTHSVGIGIDFVKHSFPRKWNNDRIIRENHSNEFNPVKSSAYWIAYYYNQKFSVRFYITDINQTAHYEIMNQTPDNFLSSRSARFNDLLIGYNLLSPLNTNPRYSFNYLNKISIWLYLGISYLNDRPEVIYKYYNPTLWNVETGGYGYIDVNYSNYYFRKIRPAAHFQIKYNPIRYIFLGIGGTYHHVGKDFKPVSGNVSLGLQL